MAVEVRFARPDDASRLTEIYVAAGRAGWVGHLRDETIQALTSPVEEWEEGIAHPEVSILVAELDGAVAAMATLLPSDDPDADPGKVAKLGRLYADPEAWGRGLGSALLVASREELERRGYAEATLWTAEWNPTRGLYEAHGWHWDGARREQRLAGETWTEVRYRLEGQPGIGLRPPGG
jgi:GNAT superfamily N-acetyltransferase